MGSVICHNRWVLSGMFRRAHFHESCPYVMRQDRLLVTFLERNDLCLLLKLICSITDDLKWLRLLPKPTSTGTIANGYEGRIDG